MSTLVEWICAHSAHVRVSDSIDPVAASSSRSAESSGSTGIDRSIVARAAISAKQTLVTLQDGAVLTGSAWLESLKAQQSSSSSSSSSSDASNLGDTGALGRLHDELQQVQLSPTVLLVLALLHECARKGQSRFGGYIAQLPHHIPLPFTWTDAARRKLKRTAASPSIDAELVASLYASAVAPLTSKFPSVWPEHESTFARFQWAYAVVSSRAFRLSGATEPALLPVIDMANHDHADPAAEIVKLDDGAFELVTRRAVAKGESVTISYGDLSNAELLCRYGFVLPESVRSDCLLVRSSELLATYAAFMNNDVDHLDAAGDGASDSDDSGAGQEQEPASKKRRVFAEKKKSSDDSDALFFRLHGDQAAEFGLGDALLSFVFAKSLPADVLYDVLAVLLRRRDKVYSTLLEQQQATADEGAAGEDVQLMQEMALRLIKHERAVCRRILIGILTLEENSSDDDDEEIGDEDNDDDARSDGSAGGASVSDDEDE